MGLAAATVEVIPTASTGETHLGITTLHPRDFLSRRSYNSRDMLPARHNRGSLGQNISQSPKQWCKRLHRLTIQWPPRNPRQQLSPEEVHALHTRLAGIFPNRASVRRQSLPCSTTSGRSPAAICPRGQPDQSARVTLFCHLREYDRAWARRYSYPCCIPRRAVSAPMRCRR